MTSENTVSPYPSLEQAIHTTFGTNAGIVRNDRVHGGDINDAYRLLLSTGEKVFIKTNTIENLKFFITESRGLLALGQAEAIGVPRVLGTGIDQEKGFSFLLLEFIESAPRRKDYWETFGHELAALHTADSPSRAGILPPVRYTQRASRNSCPSGAGGLRPVRYGFSEDNFIGASPQKNLPMTS